MIESGSESDRAKREPGDERRFRPGAAAEVREAATINRVSAAERQVGEGARRDEEATRRDEDATRRDLAADARDRAAGGRESEVARIEASAATDRTAFQRLLKEVKSLRAQAAADRAFAADDRRLAALDRVAAAEQRTDSLEALRGAHFDELTGAHRRGFAEDVLRAQVEAASASHESLVLGIVDVDGLKEINDRDGHLAGDELLRDVVEAIRANISLPRAGRSAGRRRVRLRCQRGRPQGHARALLPDQG